MGSPKTCAACSHPPHVGACSRRMGCTAYGCGCLRDTPTPPAPADDAGADARMFDFETMRTIAVGAARRARDLPYATPERCADLVLADLGIERNPGPAVRMEFESQIVFCRVCGRPPQQHPFGNCADLRIGGEPR